MNIIIYQSTAVDPEKGGISRMSNVMFGILANRGHVVHYLSSQRKGRDLLPQQLMLDGTTPDAQQLSFSKTVAEYQIDLMIYQDGITPSKNYILHWAKDKGLNVIDVIHNSLRGMYGVEGHPSLSKLIPPFLTESANRLVNLFFKCKYGKLYREQFILSDKVVLLSDKYREEITYFTGWRDFSKFTAIPNPLTLNRPASINPKKKKTVLNVGLLNNQKRQDLLLEIWKHVEEKRPDWRLRIVGDGPLRAELTEQAKRLRLRNVDFLGFQQPESYYDEASIFCLTSGFEGFGLVLVEAMAYGCVPMAFNSWAMAADIIDDEINGLLIPPFDVKEYAERLIGIMDDEERMGRMAKKAEKKSYSFNIESVSCAWAELIKELESRE